MEDDANYNAGFSDPDRAARIRDHRDLDVWRLGMDLTVEIYAATKQFPREEQFNLVSQARRAALSIPANIAEDYGRQSKQSYISFLRIAQGSARELQTLIELSDRLTYLENQHAAKLNHEITRILKMLNGLIRALENSN